MHCSIKCIWIVWENIIIRIDDWLGKLELTFSLKEEKSVLIKNKHCGPFLVQKVFYPENDNTFPHVYLLHPPGGLVGGDRLNLLVNLDAGSKVLLTTPGFAKFYRTNGRYVFQENIFKVSNNAFLEWFPQGSIFFPNTKVKSNTIFDIASDARFIACNVLFLGGYGCLNTFNKTVDIDIVLDIYLSGCAILRDKLNVCGEDYLNKLGGFKISAIFLAIPSNKIMLKKVRELIHPVKNIYIGGATLLDKLLVVRLLGNDNQTIKELLYLIWSVVRLFIIGREAMLPRIWFT